MTAIKKNTSKSAKSPAPATKSVAPKTAAKAKASPKAPAARATTQARVAVVTPPAPVASTPTIKAIAKQPVAATKITARIDIGFGNALYVRGEGAGLSWDKGVLMNCLTSDLWELALPASAKPYAFKFLVNDLTWSAGP